MPAREWGASTIQSIDRKEFAPRSEHRFLVTEEVARLAMRTAASHLDIARDDLPYQWSTTTYCDTYDWAIYRAAETGHALRLRVREYDRSRPAKVLGGSRAWIELKDDREEMSRKERFAVSPKVIPAFLRGEPVLPAEADDLVATARLLLQRGARPVVVTQYNRIAYAAPRDVTRISADHNLMYIALPWDRSEDDVVPRTLGPVLARESDVILELKWSEEPPDWATDLLNWLRHDSPDRRPSKFVVAMRHLLGRSEVRAS